MITSGSGDVSTSETGSWDVCYLGRQELMRHLCSHPWGLIYGRDTGLMP